MISGDNSKAHSMPMKKDRVIGKNKKAIARGKAFNEVDKIVDEVYVAMANGQSKSDILQALHLGNFRNHPMTMRNAYNYYNMAMDRFAVDCDIEAERLRQMFYGRYEALLEDAIKKGDIYNARGILDSMSRIFGIEKKKPDTAIQINGSSDGNLVVNFGLSDDRKDGD